MEKGDSRDMHSLISYINDYNRMVKPNNRCKIVEELNKNIKKDSVKRKFRGRMQKVVKNVLYQIINASGMSYPDFLVYVVFEQLLQISTA